MTRWLRTWLEWTLLGVGIGCVGTFGLASLEAYRFERSQAAAFERSAAPPDRTVPTPPGSLVGLLSVPRLGLSTAVVEGDDSKSLAALGRPPARHAVALAAGQ